MLVICITCRRIVGCCKEDGTIIDNCYHCRSRECSFQIPIGSSQIIEVVVSRFKNCRHHDSPHIGFKRNDER